MADFWDSFGSGLGSAFGSSYARGAASYKSPEERAYEKKLRDLQLRQGESALQQSKLKSRQETEDRAKKLAKKQTEYECQREFEQAQRDWLDFATQQGSITPEQAMAAKALPSDDLAQYIVDLQTPEEHTLGPGDVHYEGGKEVARGPEETMSPYEKARIANEQARLGLAREKEAREAKEAEAGKSSLIGKVTAMNKEFQDDKERYDTGVGARAKGTATGDKAALINFVRMQTNEALNEADVERYVSEGLMDPGFTRAWRQVYGKEQFTPEQRGELRQMFDVTLRSKQTRYLNDRNYLEGSLSPDLSPDVRSRILGKNLLEETGGREFSGMGAANAVARLMGNPRFVRWLASATTIGPDKLPAHLGRLAGIAASEDDETAQAIDEYVERIAPSLEPARRQLTVQKRRVSSREANRRPTFDEREAMRAEAQRMLLEQGNLPRRQAGATGRY